MQFFWWKISLAIVLPLFCAAASLCQGTSFSRPPVQKDDTAQVNWLVKRAKELMDTDTKKSAELLQSAILLGRKLHYHEGIGAASINAGFLNGAAGNYRQAVHNFRTAIDHFQKIGNTKGMSSGMANLGSAYEIMGLRDSAMLFYMQAVKQLESAGSPNQLGILYTNIGMLHSDLKNEDKAIYYQTKAIALARSTKDSAVLVRALTQLSGSLLKTKQPDKAAEAANESLQIATTKNNLRDLTIVFDALTQVYLHQKKWNAAAGAAKKAISYSLQLDDVNAYLEAAIGLSEAYHSLGRQHQRLAVLQQALQKSIETGSVSVRDDLYQKLADVSYRLGRHKEAYDYYTRYTVYRDSLFNERNAKIISELEIKYETAKKEKALSHKELQIVRKDLQLQKSKQFVVASIAATVVALLVIFFMYRDTRNKRKLHQRQLKALSQEKEIHLLQALMQGEEKERSRIAKDLHDGVAGMLAAAKMHFSSLTVSNSVLVQAEGYQQGMTLLDEASKEVRKTSHNLMPELLLQYGLDEAIRRYCQNITNSHTLAVVYHAVGQPYRYTGSFELSVYRIVQELLNNIIKHSKATEALVQVSFQFDLLSITIEDNGIGFAKKHVTDGMGLRTLKSRVQAMNGRIKLDSEAGSGANIYLEFETGNLVRVLRYEQEEATAKSSY